MQFEWTSVAKDADGNVIMKEKDKSNLIMNRAASLLMHRMFSKFQVENGGDWDKLMFFGFGSDETDGNDSNLTDLKDTIISNIIVSGTRLFDGDKSNSIVFTYQFDNNAGGAVDLTIGERGLFFEYEASKVLFNRLVEVAPWVLPIDGSIAGEVKFTLNA